jgi:hypothetical protein
MPRNPRESPQRWRVRPGKTRGVIRNPRLKNAVYIKLDHADIIARLQPYLS